MTPKKISLGFSPCPNDTFIFEALVNQRIDTRGLEFDVVLEDVETLNRWALEGRLDITKLSFGVLPLVLDNYILLNSGSALGSGVGPLLIGNRQWAINNGQLAMSNDEVNNHVIAIPGEHTTAHLLFSLAYPDAKKKVFMRYDKIEDFVLKSASQVPSSGGDLGEALGVIIHENRFTYEQKGLKKIIDLGDFWEKETQHAIPLGGIVARRSIDELTRKTVDGLIRRSIEYAYSQYPKLNDFIRQHSQEMSEDVMRKHIELYVNHYSLELGEEGRSAVLLMLNVYQKIHPVPTIPLNELFLNNSTP
ncbi:MAG: 1,4-dihydroxy-6-naphthoate synthase [Chitinophagaceae bacterium]|nr:1,4-dihydroxy-6-naphthoate synthase [Chitinophagaceae bacterium]MBL0056183.1 1,4-dihydroxy-6-naphthoate synthase [Chitinophagaceae bacterium]